MDYVATPVAAKNAAKLGEIEVDRLLERQGVRRGVVVIPSTRTRRKGHVLPHGEELYCADHRAENNGADRKEETPNGCSALDASARSVGHLVLGEREKERERAAGEQHVLKELRVRTQDRQADRDGETAPRPVSSIANAANQEKKGERKQRADVEFSVVTGRDVGGDRAAHQVRNATGKARQEAKSPRAKKEVGEQTGEEDMDHERPRHRDVGRQSHAKHERRIEDVAVHRGDVRHAAKQVRIPERKSVTGLEGCGGELAEGIPGVKLIAMRIDEESASERGKAESECTERVSQSRPGATERWRPLLPRRGYHRTRLHPRLPLIAREVGVGGCRFRGSARQGRCQER